LTELQVRNLQGNGPLWSKWYGGKIGFAVQSRDHDGVAHIMILSFFCSPPQRTTGAD